MPAGRFIVILSEAKNLFRCFGSALPKQPSAYEDIQGCC